MGDFALLFDATGFLYFNCQWKPVTEWQFAVKWPLKGLVYNPIANSSWSGVDLIAFIY